MTNLFVKQNFVSHSGANLEWKIDCDALTNDDIATLAFVIARRTNFSEVHGVPTGGLQLAEVLAQYTLNWGPVLIVDDVLTTGASMEKMREDFPGAIGVVLFARGQCPQWIKPVFALQN